MTLTAVSNVKAYDWATWLMGIWRAFISGGAGAIAGAFGPMLTDPKDFNLGSGLGHTFSSMGVSFLLVGTVQMCMFLQTHGAPDQLKQSLDTAAAANKEAGQAIADAKTQLPEPPKNGG